MQTIKVIFIIDSLVRGGKERRLIELIKAFNDLGYIEVMVILLKDVVQYQEIYNLSKVDVKILKRKIKKDPGVFLEIIKLCKLFKPDIIHSWGSMPSIYAIPAISLLNIIFINGMITNAFYKPWNKDWVRAKLTFPFSDIVLANSYAGIKAYNVSAKKSRIIHNGFNFSRITNLDPKEKIRNKFHIKTRYVIGMVGSFYYNKDYNLFLNAAMKILNTRNDISFILIGDGPDLQHCMGLVAPEYKNNILFLGRQENVESIVNIFDIGVLVTNNNVAKEGISNSIMEYMALGKPVIASKGGGTEEIVVDNETGIIIDAGSQNQLVQSIEYLINNLPEGYRMGSLGRKRIQENFSIEAMVSSTLDLYQELIVE